VTGLTPIRADLICHPDATVGYRITSEDGGLTYLTDHEPALAVPRFPASADWTSGYPIAERADVLIHDPHYDDAEYAAGVGWGHRSLRQAIAFAELAGAGELVTFHHDPAHSDAELDRRLEEALSELPPTVTVSPGRRTDLRVSQAKRPAKD
jgi:ribonuclease BN (tRNA processing enzyme)